MSITLPPVTGMTRTPGDLGQRLQRPRRGKMRVAMRLARGIQPGRIAQECRVGVEEVERWIGEADFAELLAGCRAMMDRPEEDRLKDLTQLALDLLEAAMHECDYRVAMFFYDQIRRGRNPGRVLAEDVNRKVLEAARPLDAPCAPPKPASPPQRPACGLPSSIARPYGAVLAEGRRRVRHDLVKSFASSAADAQTAKTATPRPAVAAADPAGPDTFLRHRPCPDTSPLALCTYSFSHNPRDGPD